MNIQEHKAQLKDIKEVAHNAFVRLENLLRNAIMENGGERDIPAFFKIFDPSTSQIFKHLLKDGEIILGCFIGENLFDGLETPFITKKVKGKMKSLDAEKLGEFEPGASGDGPQAPAGPEDVFWHNGIYIVLMKKKDRILALAVFSTEGFNTYAELANEPDTPYFLDPHGYDLIAADIMSKMRPMEGDCKKTTNIFDPFLWRASHIFHEKFMAMGILNVPGEMCCDPGEPLWKASLFSLLSDNLEHLKFMPESAAEFARLFTFVVSTGSFAAYFVKNDDAMRAIPQELRNITLYLSQAAFMTICLRLITEPDFMAMAIPPLVNFEKWIESMGTIVPFFNINFAVTAQEFENAENWRPDQEEIPRWYGLPEFQGVPDFDPGMIGKHVVRLCAGFSFFAPVLIEGDTFRSCATNKVAPHVNDRIMQFSVHKDLPYDDFIRPDFSDPKALATGLANSFFSQRLKSFSLDKRLVEIMAVRKIISAMRQKLDEAGAEQT